MKKGAEIIVKYLFIYGALVTTSFSCLHNEFSVRELFQNCDFVVRGKIQNVKVTNDSIQVSGLERFVKTIMKLEVDSTLFSNNTLNLEKQNEAFILESLELICGTILPPLDTTIIIFGINKNSNVKLSKMEIDLKTISQTIMYLGHLSNTSENIKEIENLIFEKENLENNEN